MNTHFFKFPSTPHLATLPGVDVRGDKVLSLQERDEFLQHELVIEEKVDGANLGISFDAEGNVHAQNRGAYLHLPGAGQWKPLEQWLTRRIDSLFEHLSDRIILFGEWCYAQHSVFYDRLPDWFLGFDLYDKQMDRFFSSERRDDLFRKMCINQVPIIARGCFTYMELEEMLAESRLTAQPAEGLYFRFDQGDWLVLRAKLVRAEFIQSLEQHWSRSIIKPNRLCLRTQE
ncbi:MAG: RNA ligase family protein [Synergistaceae bacterium]|jgi:ATP-dependent RNA circularization protein (DNA/RNA ligase family)|nr:RNA ligase family protein [Synergistaceae bacterium]